MVFKTSVKDHSSRTWHAIKDAVDRRNNGFIPSGYSHSGSVSINIEYFRLHWLFTLVTFFAR